jgi:hypothetical protein
MQPPALSDYQSAATAIYEPLKAADATSLAATDQTTKATLEAEKPQIATDYQSAIDTLTNSVQDQTGKIESLYANNLGGNFSGLEGNDMGELFSRANQQESTIASTEANKLTAITTAEGNADITYNADLSALTPKYQSEEEQYAESAYSTAVTDYTNNQYKSAELQLSEDRLGATEANTAATQANTTANAWKATGKSAGTTTSGSAGPTSTNNGYNFTGPNGTPVNMATYLMGSGNGAVNGQQLLDTLQNGSAYDRGIYSQVQNLSGNQLLQTVADLDSKGATIKGVKYGGANAYGF